MTDTVTKTRETTKVKIKEPSKYKVIFLNDDLTPMDFVVYVLVKIFNHSESSALSLTLKIHTEGSAIAGIYNYEIAEQKCIEATSLARQNGHPLIIKVIEE